MKSLNKEKIRNNVIKTGNKGRRREVKRSTKRNDAPKVRHATRTSSRSRFCSLKGQQQALSVILITGILIGVVGSVYLWGLPLIQKNRDISQQQNAENFMKNVAERFRFVANHAGRERLSIAVPGNVVFDPATKTLELTVETQGTTYETDTWIQLSKNGCTIQNGRWGVDEPETLCVKSAKVGDTYITVYRLSFVQLNTETLTSHKIEMSGAASSGGEGHVIVVQNAGTRTVTENNRNVVKTTLDVSVEI